MRQRRIAHASIKPSLGTAASLARQVHRPRSVSDHAFSKPAPSSVSWDLSRIPAYSTGHTFDQRRSPIPIQAKPEVGAVDDPLEAEADRAADRVMRMQDPVSPIDPEQDGGRLRRKCDACAAEEEKGQLHRKQMAGADHLAGTPAPSVVSAVLASPAEPLDAQACAFFEPRFGHDFSRVRVHSDAMAADSTRAVGAQAYTFGRDIVFARGRYAPATPAGRHLLAHELAHVVQQGGAPGTRARGDHPLARSIGPALQRREVCDENGVCRSEPGPEESAYEPSVEAGRTSTQSVQPPSQAIVTPQQLLAVGLGLFAPGDCTTKEHAALQAEVDRACKRTLACKNTDSCADLLKKLSDNQECIKARLKINMKCFRGGDANHITALSNAVLALVNCQAIYERKCRQPPVLVPVPKPVVEPSPSKDEDFMRRMERLTGLTGAALILYLIISEGTRLFPPRNLIPVP